MLTDLFDLRLYRAPDDGAGSGAGDDGGSTGGDAGDDDQGAGDEPKVPQSKVNDIATRERQQGERSAIAKVAEELGMSVEDAKKFIKDAKNADRQKMSEADRKLDEAAEKEAAAVRREEAAALRELNADVRATLIEAGVPRARADKAARLLDLKPGDDAKTITAAVEDLKPDWPELFVAKNDDDDDTKAKSNGNGRATDGDPKKSAPSRANNGKGSDALERGKDRAREANERRGIRVPAPAGS